MKKKKKVKPNSKRETASNIDKLKKGHQVLIY